MKKLLLLTKTLLAAALLCVGQNAWGDATWTFKDNTAVWAADGVTLKSGNQYDKDANTVATGGVTFTGTSGFVSTAKGIGFYAIGSTSDENISVVVPAGYKALVTILTSNNRTVIADFGGATQTYNASWASTTKAFDNSEGASPVTLYLYCNQNPGGDNQKQAPFLESIELIDMSVVTYYTFTVNAVNSADNEDIIKTLYTDTESYNGKSQSLVFSKYLTDANNVVSYSKTNNTYGQSWTATAQNETKNVEYTAYDGVAYFVEAEDVVSATGVSNWNYSKGAAVRGWTNAKSIFTVPETGYYDVTYAACNHNVSYDLTFVLSKNDSEIATSGNLKSVSVNSIKTSGIVTNNNVSLAKDDVLKLTPSSTNGIVDYMLVELKKVPATIGVNGYATFSSKYDLDFTTPVAGLTAYKAVSATTGAITLEEVTGKVKAGDGLVIKGAAGTYPIPVTTGASTIYTNKSTINMWGNISNEDETVKKADSGTNYVLSVQSGQVVFAPVKGTNATLNPGKAALWTNISTPEARALRISFDDITAVENVEAAAEAKAKEGKFIENGKLVIVKNGVKYNAAGAQVK